nr:MMPL family transporter [Chloroflexia bacterium]
MFASLGRFAYRRRWLIVAAWVALLLIAVPILPRIEEPLKVGGFSSPDTEAARARAVLERDLHFPASSLVVLFRGGEARVDDAESLAWIDATMRPVADLPHVADLLWPSRDVRLISADGDTAYAVIGLDLPPEEAQRFVPAFEAALAAPPSMEMLIAGGPSFYADIETASQRDLRRAELIAIPFALIALLLVFGSVVAAIVPLAVGGASVASVLLVLFLVARQTDLSIFVLN